MDSPNELLVLHKWLKLWSPRDGQVQSLGCKERLDIEEVEIVVIN